jgi:hypothetical protein
MSWPRDGEELWTELAAFPGRLALAVDAEQPALKLAEIIGADPCHVGALLAEQSDPHEPSQVPGLLQGCRVLVDLEILFDTAIRVDALKLLRSLAESQRGVVAVWPGTINGHRATYSEVGRFDRYVSDLADTVVLRPRQVAFPDETPFTIERIP